MTAKIIVENLSFHYGAKCVLNNVNFEIPDRSITFIVSPAASGKSTLLRALNRMNDAIPNHSISGKILIDGEDIYAPNCDPIELKRRVGMVFRRDAYFADTVYDELARRLKTMDYKNAEIKHRIENSLQGAGVWEELKDNIESHPEKLTAFQSLKLCLARTLLHNPEVILLDEPFQSLSENDRQSFEEIITTLKKQHTIVIADRGSESKRIADKQINL